MEKPAYLAACGFMKCGAGIPADRQLRGMRLILLIALSHSENHIAQIITQAYACVIPYGKIQPQGKPDGILARWPERTWPYCNRWRRRVPLFRIAAPELVHHLRIIADKLVRWPALISALGQTLNDSILCSASAGAPPVHNL